MDKTGLLGEERRTSGTLALHTYLSHCLSGLDISQSNLLVVEGVNTKTKDFPPTGLLVAFFESAQAVTPTERSGRAGYQPPCFSVPINT